jgi:hypothetical protein
MSNAGGKSAALSAKVDKPSHDNWVVPKEGVVCCMAM